MTTRQTVTLESAAGRLLRCADDCMQRFPMQVAVEIANEIRAEAALCRSAQAVIDAARKPYDGHGTQPGSHLHRCRVCDEHPSKHLPSCALAAHARNEQGTGEVGS